MPPSSSIDQHWTPGRSGAPVGTREWADFVRLKLVSQVEHLGEDDESFIGWIELLEEHRAWPLLTKRDGSTFRTIEQFCAYQRPWGLGTPWSKLRPYLAAGLAKRGWPEDKIARFLALQQVPEAMPATERAAAAAQARWADDACYDDANKQASVERVKMSVLRAINRAPESVREAYQEGRISQALAAKLGPKNPDPDTAAKVAEIAQAIRKEPDRKRVDELVRDRLGVEAPLTVRVERDPGRAATRLVERFGREWCSDLVIALDAAVNGAGRSAAE